MQHYQMEIIVLYRPFPHLWDGIPHAIKYSFAIWFLMTTENSISWRYCNSFHQSDLWGNYIFSFFFNYYKYCFCFLKRIAKKGNYIDLGTNNVKARVCFTCIGQQHLEATCSDSSSWLPVKVPDSHLTIFSPGSQQCSGFSIFPPSAALYFRKELFPRCLPSTVAGIEQNTEKIYTGLINEQKKEWVLKRHSGFHTAREMFRNFPSH